jgi:hypothetical protein
MGLKSNSNKYSNAGNKCGTYSSGGGTEGEDFIVFRFTLKIEGNYPPP